MDRTEVLERMEPVLNTQIRDIEHNPRTRIEVTPDMVTFRPGGGARTMEMTQSGVQSLANFVGLPWPIAAKLRPVTFGSVATELLGGKNRYALVVKDSAVTAVTKRGTFHTVNPERVLRTAEQAVRGLEFHRVLVMPEQSTVSLEVIGERRQPVRAGDLIQAGANIVFSPLGTVEPVVRAYALRLTCTNGATSNTVLRQFSFQGGGGGEGDDIWQWFRRSIRDAYGSLDQIVTRYRAMVEQEIDPEQRSMMLEALLRDSKITGRAAAAIRAMAVDNPPENRYDMMNLLTFATSHLLEAPRQVAQSQERVAVHMTEPDSHARLCPVCHTRRN